MTQPDLPDDAGSLAAYLQTLTARTIRGLTAGMRYRSEVTKDEMIAWLVRHNPDAVREHRSDSATGGS